MNPRMNKTQWTTAGPLPVFLQIDTANRAAVSVATESETMRRQTATSTAAVSTGGCRGGVVCRGGGAEERGRLGRRWAWPAALTATMCNDGVLDKMPERGRAVPRCVRGVTVIVISDLFSGGLAITKGVGV